MADIIMKIGHSTQALGTFCIYIKAKGFKKFLNNWIEYENKFFNYSHKDIEKFSLKKKKRLIFIDAIFTSLIFIENMANGIPTLHPNIHITFASFIIITINIGEEIFTQITFSCLAECF